MSDKPSRNDVHFTDDEYWSGKTRTYLLIEHVRGSKVWYILPDRNIAVIYDKVSHEYDAKEPPEYMIREAFWANLTKTANSHGDRAYYIGESHADSLEEQYHDIQGRKFRKWYAANILTTQPAEPPEQHEEPEYPPDLELPFT